MFNFDIIFFEYINKNKYFLFFNVGINRNYRWVGSAWTVAVESKIFLLILLHYQRFTRFLE